MPMLSLTTLLKLTLTPALTLAAVGIGKRYGPKAGGLIASMPLIAGPILLLYGLDNPEKAAEAAGNTWLATIPLCLFCLSYALVAKAAASRGLGDKSTITLCLPAGWGTFLLLGWALHSLVSPGTGISYSIIGYATAAQALLLGLMLFWRFPAMGEPKDKEGLVTNKELHWAWRVLTASAMVSTVSFTSDVLGPNWTGTLATFPVLGSVLVAFEHKEKGPCNARLILLGYLRGMPGLILFCLVLHLATKPLGFAWAFPGAVILCAAYHIGALFALKRLAARRTQRMQRQVQA